MALVVLLAIFLFGIVAMFRIMPKVQRPADVAYQEAAKNDPIAVEMVAQLKRNNLGSIFWRGIKFLSILFLIFIIGYTIITMVIITNLPPH